MSKNYDKTFTTLKTVVHDTSILDAQKILIKTAEDSGTSRSDLIEYIKGENNKTNNSIIDITNKIDNLTSIIDNSEWNEIKQQIIVGISENKDYISHTGETAATEGEYFKIDKNHFINDKNVIIKRITLPYIEGAAGGFSNPNYCHLYAFDADNNFIGNPIISTSTATRPNDTAGETTWDFAGDETCKLVDDYAYVYVKISESNASTPGQAGGKMRVTVAKINGVSDHGSFGDNCKVGTSNYLALIKVNYDVQGDTILERVEKLENLDLSNIINTSIAELEATVSNHTTDINNLQTTVKGHTTNINNINSSIEGLETAVSNNTTEIENIKSKIGSNTVNEVFSNLTGDTAETEGTAIQLSKDHFIKPGSLISSIQLPYRENNLQWSNQYCHLQFFTERGGQPTVTYNSTNTQSRTNTEGISVWSFENVEVPEYLFVRITVSGSQVEPNLNGQSGNSCTPFRINVVRYEESVRFDTDDCKIWNKGSEDNFVGEVKAEYTISVSMEETIINLGDKINKLEAKNYAYTDAPNVFTKDITIDKSLLSAETNTQVIHNASLHTSKSINIGRESLNSEELHNIKNIVLGHNEVVVSNMEGSGAIGQVIAARLANPFFASGTISNVRIFHNTNHTNLFDNDPRYLYLNVDGTVYRSEAVVWDGPVSYTDFKFNNITIPENYTLVDVLMSKNGALENPSYSNRTGSVNFSSVIVYAASTYGNSRVRIHQNGEVEIGQSAIIKVEVTTGITNDITIAERVSLLEENGTNSEEINDIKSKITAIANIISDNKTTLQNEINEVKNNIEEIVQTEINDNLLGKDTNRIFDSNNLGVGNGDYTHNDGASITGAKVSKAHFINPGCKLKSFTIPYKSNTQAWNNQWLHIQYFTADGTKIIQHTSESPQNITTAGDNYVETTWTFANDKYVPSDYAYIQVNISGSANDVPTLTQNCTSFRASLVRNNNNQTFDSDECHIWMTNGSNDNQLLHYRVEYIERVGAIPQLDTLVENAVDNVIKNINEYSFKVKPVYDGESLSHFDVSSGNVYLENKQIVKIPAKTNLQMNSSTGNTQYVVLNVFNNPNGSVTYAYNAVNEDELIELGYSIITPTEEIINLNN